MRWPKPARRVGGQILVAAAATAAGFLAFVPTDFRGVAELGLIAGVGMLIAFVCTMTFLPAAISLFRPHGESAEVGFRLGGAAGRARPPLPPAAAGRIRACWRRSGWSCCRGSASMPIRCTPKTRTPRRCGRSYDLGDSPLTNPFTIDILTPNAGAGGSLGGEAAEAAAGLRRAVDQQLRAGGPADQTGADRRCRHPDGPEPVPAETLPPPTAQEIRTAAEKAHEKIEPALAKLPADHVLGRDRRRIGEAGRRARCRGARSRPRADPLFADHSSTGCARRCRPSRDIADDTCRNWPATGCCRTGGRASRCCRSRKRATPGGSPNLSRR